MTTAPNAAPKNIVAIDSSLLANLGLLPFASEESAPIPEIVSVRTVVVRSRIASLRTAALHAPIASAVKAIRANGCKECSSQSPRYPMLQTDRSGARRSGNPARLLRRRCLRTGKYPILLSSAVADHPRVSPSTPRLYAASHCIIRYNRPAVSVGADRRR